MSLFDAAKKQSARRFRQGAPSQARFFTEGRLFVGRIEKLIAIRAQLKKSRVPQSSDAAIVFNLYGDLKTSVSAWLDHRFFLSVLDRFDRLLCDLGVKV